MNSKYTKGFTLIELLVVISIGAMLALLSVPLFNSIIFNEDLNSSVETILSSVRTAQARAINGKNGTKHGVYFDNSSVPSKYILFEGDIFTPGDPNNVEYDISERITITNLNLNGSTNYILFNKFSGETDNFGSITFQNNIDDSQSITINQIGVSDIQYN